MKNQRLIICAILLLTIGLATLQTVSAQHTNELHEAAAACDLNKEQALIEANPSFLESKDNNGNTPRKQGAGIGFLFEVDGVKIFNGLSYASTNEASVLEGYRQGIAWFIAVPAEAGQTPMNIIFKTCGFSRWIGTSYQTIKN
jgi:hypothetical protein